MPTVTFLGTSCMQPTKERNHSALFFPHDTEGILFDCGENTQRQLKIAGIRPTKITRIFLTHWHGDHVLGLPGLLQTMAAAPYVGTLHVYGPKGSKERFGHMFRAFDFDAKLDLVVHDIEPGVVCDASLFEVHAAMLDHGVPCFGYRWVEKDKRRIKVAAVKKLGIPDGPLLGELQRGRSIEWKGKRVPADELTFLQKGKVIAYVVDAAPCKGAIDLAQGADLLICEAAYANALEDKGEQYKHLTARDAATIARKADAKQLVLTHFSQRYASTEDIEEDAKEIFPDVVCAYDFLKVKC